MTDIIIVGGGPAGMTAALYARRNGKSALVIEKAGFGGQITHSPKVENIPGTLSISGNAFADQMMEQILAQGADIEIETVTGVEDAGDRKIVRTEEGSAFEGRAVILATGVEHRMLGLPGEEDLVGDGISYCAVCDGDFYSGKTVCMAGGGNSALQEAILLSEKCKEVILLQDLPHFTGEERLQEVLFARPNVRALTGVKITGFETKDGALTGVRVAANAAAPKSSDGDIVQAVSGQDEGRNAAHAPAGGELPPEQIIPCDGLFVAIGLIPRNAPFAELADLNAWGYFDADEGCRTKTPGVFVAGDCRSKEVRQVATAAADGATAALAACRYVDGV